MKWQKILFIALIFVLTVIVILGFVVKNRVQTQVKDLFRMNKTLQEEGYYMADFEFQMVGFGYYLGKGEYFKSVKLLNDFHKKLSNKTGLIKISEFKTKQEEITFYLNLQNPKTGAFIDESAPYCTYWEISQNIINHLEALANSSSSPINLKYPLKFLDEINTPEKLIVFLEDVSYVNWLGSKFPQTSFHFARNILSEAIPGNTLDRTKLYQFSPEWKHTMLKWMYEFQDSTTGMWGPKNKKNNKLRQLDLNNTASILKSFRDNEGNDLHKEYPLKYKNQLFTSAIKQLSEPFPNNDDLDEIHEWNLQQSKGINMLLRHLWKDASVENKHDAEMLIKKYVRICFEKYYVENEGAFSYYPNAEHASCDGITNLPLDDIGALSYNKQKKYWGDPVENAQNLGIATVKKITGKELEIVTNISEINSYRIYTVKPDFKSLSKNVWAVYYPNTTKVLDITELVPNIIHWTETSNLSIGNWTSMAEIKNRFSSLNIKNPLVFYNELPFDELNGMFNRSSEIYIIGFDILQIPRFIIGFN